MRFLLARLVVCSLLLIGLGCGGGGGGGGEEENEGVAAIDPVGPELIGPYHYFEFVMGTTAFRFTEVGPAEIDATGLLTGFSRRYFEFLTTPEEILRTVYTVERADGTLFNRETDGDILRSGGLGVGNHLAALTASGDGPNLLVLVRPSAETRDDDLSGRYHFCLFSPKDAGSTWGRVDLDGRGEGTLPAPADASLNGRLATAEFASLAYQVRSGGDLDLTIRPDSGPDLEFVGVASHGGRLLATSRVDDADVAKPLVLLAVRGPQNADETLLNGRYWFVGVVETEDDLTGELRFTTINGALEADGRGGCVLNAVAHNSNGTFNTLADETASYTISRDGALQIELTGIDIALSGGLDAQGRHAILGSSHVEGFFPGLVILARKP